MIQEQIEKKARENADLSSLKSDFPHHWASEYSGYIAGANLILEAMRWRDKGLPKLEDAGISVTVQAKVNLKSKNQDLTTVLDVFYDYDVEGWFLLIPLPKKYKITILAWRQINLEEL